MDLLEEIEELRKEMYTIFNHIDHLSDPKIVTISQALDQRLNEYALRDCYQCTKTS